METRRSSRSQYEHCLTVLLGVVQVPMPALFFIPQTVIAATDAFRAAASLPRRVVRRLPLIIAMSHLLPVVRVVLLSCAEGSVVGLGQSQDLRRAGEEDSCLFLELLHGHNPFARVPTCSFQFCGAASVKHRWHRHYACQ